MMMPISHYFEFQMWSRTEEEAHLGSWVEAPEGAGLEDGPVPAAHDGHGHEDEDHHQGDGRQHRHDPQVARQAFHHGCRKACDTSKHYSPHSATWSGFNADTHLVDY